VSAFKTQLQVEQFGKPAAPEAPLREQVVTLVLRGSPDVRCWDWETLLDEVDVDMVGWHSDGVIA
jgi:hypothetical protein